MATAEQLKALIRSHFSDDSERFLTLALQVAAHEAKHGHGPLAHEIRELVDRARSDHKRKTIQGIPTELDTLIEADLPGVPLSTLVVPEPLLERIHRILHEYRQRDKLRLHGLKHRRKILLTGPPGTGKTLTARVLANELRLPLFTVQADRLVTKFMGETSARLRQMFELIREREGVYLFDEFDALGGGRTRENDVGEMRRVLTALLQFIEAESSDSIIVASTNSPELLDRALFRRFDDILSYDLPGDSERKRLISNTLGTFMPKTFSWTAVILDSSGLSSAETVEACLDALKEAVLKDRSKINSGDLLRILLERRHGHGG